jgi:hypothetical protein
MSVCVDVPADYFVLGRAGIISRSHNQKILCLLWKTKIYYRVY